MTLSLAICFETVEPAWQQPSEFFTNAAGPVMLIIIACPEIVMVQMKAVPLGNAGIACSEEAIGGELFNIFKRLQHNCGEHLFPGSYKVIQFHDVICILFMLI